MSQLKAADFPPPEALICLKPTADPDCRVGGFDGRCHCEVPEQTLSVPHPNLHLSQGLKYKFAAVCPTFRRARLLGSARSHMVLDQKTLQEVIIVRHRAYVFWVSLTAQAVWCFPQTVYTQSVCTLSARMSNMEAVVFVITHRKICHSVSLRRRAVNDYTTEDCYTLAKHRYTLMSHEEVQDCHSAWKIVRYCPFSCIFLKILDFETNVGALVAALNSSSNHNLPSHWGVAIVYTCIWSFCTEHSVKEQNLPCSCDTKTFCCSCRRTFPWLCLATVVQ